MEFNRLIRDFEKGIEIEGFYILKNATPKTTAAGKAYLNAVLADRTGTIEAKLWDYTGPIGLADEGKVVKIRGNVTEYRGELQVTIERIRMPVVGDKYEMDDLVSSAPIDVDEYYEKLTGYVDSITDEDYRKICAAMLERHSAQLKDIPAAKSMHHSFLHGLLMHTVDMLKTADFLAGHYAEVIDRSLLIAGTMLHDIAKIEEFTFSELGLVSDYALKGQLLGHLTMGAEEVGRLAEELGAPEEKAILLRHMLLSHHGEPEYGAAVRPMCAEAELLSYIDLIDSRMEIYAEVLEDVPAGKFSGRVAALDGKRLYSHLTDEN